MLSIYGTVACYSFMYYESLSDFGVFNSRKHFPNYSRFKVILFFIYSTRIYDENVLP